MKSLSWIIICVLGILSDPVFAQKKLSIITLDNIESLNEHINASEDLNNSLQRIESSFVLFVKFYITDSLKAENLEFAGNGPQAVKQALKTTIISSGRFWNFTDQERQYVRGKYFILPFFYYYDPSNYGLHEIKKLTPSERTEQLQNLTFKMNKDINEINKGIRQMLNFEEKSFSHLDCILIKPIVHSVIQ